MVIDKEEGEGGERSVNICQLLGGGWELKGMGGTVLGGGRFFDEFSEFWICQLFDLLKINATSSMQVRATHATNK